MKAVGGDRVEMRPGGLTIGQLATCARVTIKAVRHYHRRGLLAEPSRDASGYRRYTAEHAIQLIKVRTLAEAGVPLARIKELLASNADQFSTAMSEIDRTLQARIDRLQQLRERIAQLDTGERLFVSADVADFLDQLRELGISHRGLRVERDMWILMQAASPVNVQSWIVEKRRAMSDAEFRAICLEYDAAFDWSPDDPRLYALADRAQRWTADQRGRSNNRGRSRTVVDEAIARLVATSDGASSPAWERLVDIIRERAPRTGNQLATPTTQPLKPTSP